MITQAALINILQSPQLETPHLLSTMEPQLVYIDNTNTVLFGMYILMSDEYNVHCYFFVLFFSSSY